MLGTATLINGPLDGATYIKPSVPSDETIAIEIDRCIYAVYQYRKPLNQYVYVRCIVARNALHAFEKACELGL